MKQLIKYVGIIATIITISGCFFPPGYYHHWDHDHDWDGYHCRGHHTYCR